LLSSNEHFTLAQKDGVISLQSTLAKSSAKAKPDEQLTFNEMSAAKAGMLEDMVRAGYPEQYTTSLQQFFYILENHELRRQPYGDEILVLLQARVRRDWHADVKRKEGWDIAKFKRLLLQQIKEEFHDSLRLKKLREVCYHLFLI
jgi:hypothetical protein